MRERGDTPGLASQPDMEDIHNERKGRSSEAKHR